ncbi:MAG: hypothetical protein Fur0020_00320 [Thermodesulfovibrionia bacterium]
MEIGCNIVADDYGITDDVNSAILELVKKNIVSKVGVMVNDIIDYSIYDIRNYNREIGLHLNLTSYERGKGINPDKEIAPSKFLYYLYTNQDENMIIDNIDYQFEFLKRNGFKISYIDTHLHIHIFPKLSRLIINYAKAKGIDSIRCITMQRRHMIFYINSLVHFGFLRQLPKIIFLYSLGGVMKSILDISQMKYCKNLVLMPLAKDGDYSGLLRVLLKRFRDVDAEIVTHPGFETKIKYDRYTTGRYIEFCALINLMQDTHLSKIGLDIGGESNS